jgi:hypothetical protein
MSLFPRRIPADDRTITIANAKLLEIIRQSLGSCREPVIVAGRCHLSVSVAVEHDFHRDFPGLKGGIEQFAW